MGAQSSSGEQAPEPTPDEGVGRVETPSTSLWRNGNFLKFWAGETISLFGAQVTLLALPLTAVLALHGGPGELGFIRFLQFFPYLVFGLPFGVWVDRSRRRPVMIGANLVRLILIGLVPILAALGQLSVAVLFVITFGVGTASVLFDVTWMSYVPTLVEGNRDFLIAANTKLGATSSAADAAGPGLGGALVSAFTAPIAMAVNAASYAVSIVSLLLIRLPEQRPARTQRRLVAELSDGLRFVFGNRYLRVVAAVGAASNFFLSATLAMFVLYAVDQRGISPGLLGVILSATGVGGVLGALSAGRLIRQLGIGRTYTLTLSLTFLAPLVIPAAHGSTVVLVLLYISAFFLAYGGMSVANVVVLSLRQAITPTPLMGRMNAAMRTVMFGLAALGGPFGGTMGSLIGLRGALWVSAVGSALILVPLVLSPVGRLREMPAVAQFTPAGLEDAVPVADQS
jgi:MFS family permease